MLLDGGGSGGVVLLELLQLGIRRGGTDHRPAHLGRWRWTEARRGRVVWTVRRGGLGVLREIAEGAFLLVQSLDVGNVEFQHFLNVEL